LKEAKKAEPPDLTVKKYANTHFVNVMVEKRKMREGKIQLEEPPEGLIKIHENEDPVRVKIERGFYRQLEETAEKLETTPDKLIYNAILLLIKTIREK